MSYKLRFIQQFKQEYEKQYLDIERQFEEFEKSNPQAPVGKRYLCCSGRDASNTLVWECDFDTLSELQQAHAFFLTDSTHEDLFRTQAEFIIGTYTEIYKPINS